VLAEEARGEDGHDVIQIGQGDAERIAASLAGRYWPPMPPSCPGFSTRIHGDHSASPRWPSTRHFGASASKKDRDQRQARPPPAQTLTPSAAR